jgi:hypothetical protein
VPGRFAPSAAYLAASDISVKWGKVAEPLRFRTVIDPLLAFLFALAANQCAERTTRCPTCQYIERRYLPPNFWKLPGGARPVTRGNQRASNDALSR